MKAAETPAMSQPDAKVWPLSVPAYHVLGEAGLIPKNTELLYGVVYQKMSKSPMHSVLVGRILKLLGQTPLPGYVIRSEQPLTCNDSEPEPDIAVVRGTDDDFWGQHPTTADLVIEVCVTSHDYDRSKLRAYADAKVKEVWFVLVPEKQIEIHRRPAKGQFAEKTIPGPGGRLASETLPHFTVALSSFFER
jgi:Uma2 family endonuclease